MQKMILVYGWYNHGNIGDELFKQAFKQLFPQYRFVFTDYINNQLLNEASAVFIGGGSFLYAPLNISKFALEHLSQHKIFYLGIGLETEMHPMHRQLMSLAKLIAPRSSVHLSEIKDINSNVLVITDLVYSLEPLIKKSKTIPNSVLIIPNISVIPTHQDPNWKHMAWMYFKSEFAQFLDFLIDHSYNIKFCSLCCNRSSDDKWASAEIISHMKNRKNYILDNLACDIGVISSLFSQYQTIITQRFHGIILSEMVKVPYISLSHHDKIKYCDPHHGSSISYYSTSKNQLLGSFQKVQQINFPDSTNNFIKLQERVINLIEAG